MEEAFYESPVLRSFAGVDLGRAAAPDETTILRFRHLLEKHSLGAAILVTVKRHLDARGIRITTGTIVDATICLAPSDRPGRTERFYGASQQEYSRPPISRSTGEHAALPERHLEGESVRATHHSRSICELRSRQSANAVQVHLR
jgi:IS5 family transposase